MSYNVDAFSPPFMGKQRTPDMPLVFIRVLSMNLNVCKYVKLSFILRPIFRKLS